MTDNMKLCNVCLSVISTGDLDVSIYDPGASSPDTVYDYPHHANDHDLYRAAEAGCPLCTILWDFFSDHKDIPELSGKTSRGQGSFTFSVHYCKNHSNILIPYLPTVPWYRFKKSYADSAQQGDTDAAVLIDAFGVEGELIH
jgi:hypothetical protein